MPVSIRDAVLADIPAIQKIEHAAPSAAHWSAEQYQTRIGAGSVILAEQASRICGFLCAHVVAGEWEIENVVVAEDFRRRGIGAALVRALLNKWETAGGSAVLLEVRESNASARALYEASGLRDVGRRRAYYREPVEDAILYALYRQI
jgi:[ribosomal protein S18]-alanine N-acetyltransferase